MKPTGYCLGCLVQSSRQTKTATCGVCFGLRGLKSPPDRSFAELGSDKEKHTRIKPLAEKYRRKYA